MSCLDVATIVSHGEVGLECALSVFVSILVLSGEAHTAGATGRF